MRESIVQGWSPVFEHQAPMQPSMFTPHWREEERMPVYAQDRTIHKPVREICLSTRGELLSCSGPRYDSLDQYVEQFAAPCSALYGAGVFCFQDWIDPRLRILVECTEIDWCGRCDQSLEDCDCRF
jgi:hypothetical protein